MANFLTILIIIVSILLVLIVLVQNSKGGGLTAGFQSSNQIIGVRQTADFLEKATWTLVISLVVLIIVCGIVRKTTTGTEQLESKLKDAVEAPAQNMPSFPTEAPQQQQQEPAQAPQQ